MVQTHRNRIQERVISIFLIRKPLKSLKVTYRITVRALNIVLDIHPKGNKEIEDNRGAQRKEGKINEVPSDD